MILLKNLYDEEFALNETQIVSVRKYYSIDDGLECGSRIKCAGSKTEFITNTKFVDLINIISLES